MMKLITAVLLTSLMQVSAATYGQFVTLKERNVTLERMFKEIRQQSGYDVLLSTNKIKSSTTINANFTRATIEEVMAKILADKDLTYTIEDKTILISPKAKSLFDKVVDYFVAVRVTGKVRDKSGAVLPGVSVREKGASNAVSTTASGDYSISVKEGATLVFSFIGYKNVEVEVGSKTTINVTLEEDAAQLKEVNVVSTGYQKIDRKLFTGSASLVKAEDAQRNGVPDVSRMLEGQVAGVTVQNVSGTFGAAPKIRVRGATSLSGDNKPLWVVDGIILEDVVNISNEALSTGDANTLIGSSVAGLNGDDIESFTILKDAAATALYGARAMNGVVVVTTKKGRITDGSPRISYTGNFTTYLKPSYESFDILNSADQMSVLLELENKGYFQHTTASRGSEGGVFYKMYNSLYDYNPSTDSFALRNDISSRNNFLKRYANANTDWFDVLFKNSLLQEHSLSVTSGTEKFQTYTSTSYLHDNGQTVGNSVDRFTGNFRATAKMSDKLSFELLANGSVRDQRAPGTLERTSDPVYGKYSRDFDINPYSYALNTSRTMTAFDENGNREFFTRNFSPFNILHELENNYLTLGQIDFKVQGGIRYKIIPTLTYSVDGAYRYAKTERQHYQLESSNMVLAYRNVSDATTIGSNKFLYTDPSNPYALPESVLPEGGFYNTTTDNLKNYYFNQKLEFDKIFNTDHHLYVLGLMEVRYTDRQTENFDGVGYQYENGGIVNSAYKYFKWAQESGFPYFGMQNTYDRFTGFLANAAYSYKEKYTLNASTRLDGSNKMGKSRTARWLPTWNVSGKWFINNESFWPKDSKIFTAAALRATYGLTANIGNARNSSAIYYNQVTRRPYDNEKETATYISGLENSELTWEKNKELNIGTDLSFFNNRVNLTLDVYTRNIYDLIGQINTSGIGGQFEKTANYASMSSKGIEFTLGGNPISHDNFKWRTNFNIAYNKNEITSLKVNPNIFSLVDADGGVLEGYSQRGLFSVQFAGLDHDRGYPYYIDEDGVRNTYINLQSTSVEHLKYEGPVDPKLTGGFYNQFRYKNFSLSTLLTFATGNVVRLANTYQSSYSDIYSMSKDMLNRWVMPGDEKFTNIPALLDPFDASQTIKDASGASVGAVYPYNLYNFSTERVAKGDFVRFKQISLTYDIPKTIYSRLHMTNASISFVGNNIALLYSDKRLNGQDPEFFGSGGVALPIPKQYTLSLKVGF
ncbi:SusC/RagA family TonB-linked outer membrane protein [Pedobacter frigidisoli]|uniref:SusC/RagA family TonB-linked outer membrane protein n=1 Tax=Pedobacter frigidisoli TaxID=2530455 RepID=UPI00292DFD94|nr:SusC/RagA family TonB-linked outer membrane protein [Pedobacter frigidisoli]